MRFGTPACFMNIVSGAKHRPPPIELANEKTCWSRAGWCSSAHRSRVGGLFWPVLLWECRMLPWAAFGRGSSRPYTIVPLRLASRGLQCRCLLRWVGAPLVDLSSARFLTSLRPCRLLLECGPISKNEGSAKHHLGLCYCLHAGKVGWRAQPDFTLSALRALSASFHISSQTDQKCQPTV